MADRSASDFYLVGLNTTERSALKPERHHEEIIASGVATAADGELPAGAAGREVKETVEIPGTDKYKKAIAFRGADGKFRETSMDAPHLENRLEQFKKGEKYEVVYREALAVFVAPE